MDYNCAYGQTNLIFSILNPLFIPLVKFPFFGLFHLHSRYIVQILVQTYFELVSSVLALDTTEPVSEPVTQMAVELINIHLISVQQKR